MTRREPPSMIPAAHADTRLAEARREQARPKAEPVIHSEEPPAPPEPTKPSRPARSKIVVETRPVPLKRGQVPDASTIDAVLDYVFPGGK